MFFKAGWVFFDYLPSFLFSGALYFLLIFSTWVKFFDAARRLCLKRKLFLANEYL